MNSNKQKKFALAGALGIAMWMSSVIIPTSCGSRVPNKKVFVVGEKTIVTPLPAQYALSALPANLPQKILLSFDGGGKQVEPDSGAVIQFYESLEGGEPFYTIAAKDFKFLHLRTGCASGDVALLENNIESDVLICDGSLNLNRIRRMELVYPNGKKKEATSLAPDYQEGDVLAAGVMFR
ncbi:MAG: hypothetical protein FJY29_05390 [Betaproteobacteria bacterium]|nr:hypothetical protein [Betaproteobacteria bacterium]